MGNDILMMVIKLIIIMPVMIVILYYILKYSNSKLQASNKNKIVNVVEKTAITKNSCILVVKITDEYYAMYVSGDKSRILMRMDKDKVEEVRQRAMKSENISDNMASMGILKSFIKKKEEKNEDK